MKKFKKLIAGLSAAAMAMTVGVSAFAAQAGTATASYGNGYVVLDKTDDIDTTNQWTVVIISKDKQNATLADTDLLYINQGTGEETFWKGTIAEDGTITAGMGVKGGTLADGDYIIRIGGETITDASNLIEIALNVSTTPAGTTYTYGDVDNNGEVDIDDAMEILYYYNFMESVFDDGAEWRLTAGDVDKTGEVDIDDSMEVLYYYNFMESVFDTMEDTTFTE